MSEKEREIKTRLAELAAKYSFSMNDLEKNVKHLFKLVLGE